MSAAASEPDVGPERAVALALAAAAKGPGGDTAMTALYTELSPKLWQYVNRRVRDPSAVEDIHSDTWLSAFQHIGSYDPKKAGVLGWLYTIASRKIADHFRSTSKRHTHELAASLIAGDTHTTEQGRASRQGTSDEPADAAVTLASREVVRDVLAGLSRACRDAVLLTVFDGLTNAEAAGVLGITENAVKQNRYRGLLRLKDDGLEIRARLADDGVEVVHTVNAETPSREVKRTKG